MSALHATCKADGPKMVSSYCMVYVTYAGRSLFTKYHEVRDACRIAEKPLVLDPEIWTNLIPSRR